SSNAPQSSTLDDMSDYEYSRPPDGDRSQGWALLSVCWGLVVAAMATTALRVWVRARLTRNLGWDDYYMLAAMVGALILVMLRACSPAKVTTCIGLGLITTEVIAAGLGRHSYYLQPEQRRLFTVLGWADWVQTFITLMLTKISICLFLLRIVDHRKIRISIYVLIGCLVLWTFVSVFLFLGICRPLNAYWDYGVDGVCMSDRVIENIVIAQGGSFYL
ncbi:MAG: hypothetical protein Q9183_002677, partial [Haloplaca sp. 2 TL-2023]